MCVCVRVCMHGCVCACEHVCVCGKLTIKIKDVKVVVFVVLQVDIYGIVAHVYALIIFLWCLSLMKISQSTLHSSP